MSTISSTAKPFSIDFFVIGPERTGTTWLHQCLKEHPEVCVSEPKELNFFNTTQSFWRTDLVGKTKYNGALEGYFEHFGHCVGKRVYGEVTPIYIHAPEVPERLRTHFPKAKIIAVLRNPTERFFSHYMYTKLKGAHELPTLEEIIKTKPSFIEESFYMKHLENYLKVFSRDQILITFYDDMRADPKKYMRDIFSFIGVDASFVPPSLATTINSAGATLLRRHALRARKLLKALPFGEPLLSLFRKTPLHQKVVRSIDTRAGTGEASYGTLDPKLKEALRARYEPELQKLEAFTGRDLSAWRS